MEDLRRNKHFPLYPDGRRVTADFFERHPDVSYGQRVFGFIHPPKTGMVSGETFMFLSSRNLVN